MHLTSAWHSWKSIAVHHLCTSSQIDAMAHAANSELRSSDPGAIRRHPEKDRYLSLLQNLFNPMRLSPLSLKVIDLTTTAEPLPTYVS
jgi:hypothetical protein